MYRANAAVSPPPPTPAPTTSSVLEQDVAFALPPIGNPSNDQTNSDMGTIPDQSRPSLDLDTDIIGAMPSSAAKANAPLLEIVPKSNWASMLKDGVEFPSLFINATDPTTASIVEQLWVGTEIATKSVCDNTFDSEQGRDGATISLGNGNLPKAVLTSKAPIADVSPTPDSVGPIVWDVRPTVLASPTNDDGEAAGPVQTQATNFQYLARVRNELFAQWTGLYGFQDRYGFVIDMRK